MNNYRTKARLDGAHIRRSRSLHKKQALRLLVYPNAHRNNGFTPTMPEHPSDVRTDVKTHRSLFERLTALISPEPENRAELLDVLHDAHERNLIDADALSMIEGVFQVSDLSVRDIMVPR
ncbi:MAG: hypothetical protein ACXWC4_25000, partial [Telluria sp.]